MERQLEEATNKFNNFEAVAYRQISTLTKQIEAAKGGTEAKDVEQKAEESSTQE